MNASVSLPQPLLSHPVDGLAGEFRVPGDKSISHRALLLSALACGRTAITNLLEAEDVHRTAAAIRALGVPAARSDDGVWQVDGVGIGGLGEPDDVLDMGNSGTAARLLLGVLAGHPLTAFLTGDASLRGRPMARVTDPLREVGARFVARSGWRLPLTVTGAGSPMPITYRLPVASAQVKSAVLLAGLNAPGRTTVIEGESTRDHTERMLRLLGATVTTEPLEETARAISVEGQPELVPHDIDVPGDPSSAAFPAVAALTVPGSALTLRGIGANPARLGLYETLREMGADIVISAAREVSGEPVMDVAVRSSRLTGVVVPPERAPTMIDEYPALAVAAAAATGRTVMHGLAELRVKESDRLAAIEAGLRACGVAVESGPDWLGVMGSGGRPPGGGAVLSGMDHRIAMAFLVLGMAAERPVAVDDGAMIATSFPGFTSLMNAIGARIEAGTAS